MNDIREFHTVRGYQLLEQKKGVLTSAMEDYLEMIYRSSLEEGYLRINKLAAVLNVQAPSATKMVQKLTQLGLLDYQKYGIIMLTDKGKQIGEFLLNRHQIIETFLKSIGISQNILAETELIEHSISIHTLKTIDLFNEFIVINPEFVEKFEEYKKVHLINNESASATTR
jgi:Mn-dependent DtxR family transcriptional regulator